MVPQITVSRGLETLPARPPTPPREKTVDVTNQKQLLARKSLGPRRSLSTPPGYSPDSSDLSDPSSRRTRKKVGFSTQAEYRDAPSLLESVTRQPTPVSASSTASLPKPLKSILKPSPPAIANPLDPCEGADEETRHANIATMLESTTKQLAGADRASKLDAYMMLVRALKTSNNLPDRIALQDKMSLFTQFIQRDITTKNAAGDLDMSLSNHASTLLITFLNFPAIASTLPNDFGVFMIDHCIRSFEDATIPKDVVRHLMQVVASQNFPPKVMTADRVGRLVASLHRIEEHLTGKSIVMSRILIYRRLIKQSKPHMTTHSDWLLDLFSDMLSSVKEIRATAIALGLEASFGIGKEKQLSRRVMEILDLVAEERKYIEYYVERLKAMALSKDKHESSAVPQIWSVVILLLRCPVDRWEFFGPWLEIIQLCFNSGDLQTKFEANYAWNRLVYCLQLNEQSSPKTIGVVCQPFLTQLKRRKLNEELRKVCFGSVCNLYYYAFRPNTSPSHTDNFWDSCIPQIIQAMVAPEMNPKGAEQPVAGPPDHTHQAILILTSLFNSTTPRIWKEDHIADSPIARPDELPALDPKWVRRNAAKIFAVIEPILMKTYLDISNPGSPVAKLWKALITAVASAASKEIKVSTDTAVFMAHIFTFLFRVWSRGLSETGGGEEGSRRLFEATRVFLTMVIDSVGLLPFTEKQLSMGKQNTFLPVATPSHRPGKGQGVTRTPLHHLFSILSSLPPGADDNEWLAGLLRSVLSPFLTPKSPRTKVDLVHELMQSLPMDTLAPYGPWLVVSEVLSESLESSQLTHSSTGSGSLPPVGHEYREIVKHLDRGLRSTPKLPWKHWQSLFQALATRASDETGAAGCAIAIIEPLAKTILDIIASDSEAKNSINLFRSGIELISNSRQPRDRHAVDAARLRLWGTSISGSRSASFDTFDNLYRLIDQLLHTSYNHFNEYETGGIIVPLITEVAGFLTRCNQLLVFKTLVHLQNGIGIWIQDTEGRYGSRQSPSVSEAVKMLWDRICNIFIKADNLEQVQLDMIEPLLCSAFESKHRHTVNTLASLWNSAFDQAEKIEYPARLKSVLLSVRSYAYIVLPGLDISSYGASRPQPSFVESQDDLDVPSTKSSRRNTPQSERPSSSRRSNTPGSGKVSIPSKRRLESTPDVPRSKSARRSATPRLRHDNSQIQFAVIASSSPIGSLESQVLTERQKEVRERQQHNATLFPNIRPSADTNDTRPEEPRESSGEDRPEKVATPKSHRSFEDYVSSTPTPRRGQAPLIEDNDHEMTDDIPSSPPDPRRYPLVPELNKAHSSSSSVLDEYQFLSSPLSGSPRLGHRTAAIDRNIAPEHPQESSEDGGRAETEPTKTAPEAAEVSEDEGDRADIEDDVQGHPMAQDKVEDILPPAVKEPVTPPHGRDLKVQDTPKSDTEVFVDALTSPAPRTPRAQRALARASQAASITTTKASQPKDRSFDASDVDERSLLRLVVELDSRKCEPLSAYTTEEAAAEEGPSQIEESQSGESQNPESPVLDCITVNTGSSRRRGRSRKSKSGRSSSPVIPSTPADASNSQEPNRQTKKKRKRTSDKSQEQGSQESQESNGKKRRHSQEHDVDVETVPDSQLLPVNDNALVEQSHVSDEEQPTSFSQESPIEGQENNEEVTTETADVAVAYSPMDEREAVNLQIVQEASQSAEEEGDAPVAEPAIENAVDEEMEPRVDEPHATGVDVAVKEIHQEDEGVDQQATAAPETAEEAVLPQAAPEKSSMEKIMDALRGGLAELRSAALSRQEVYQVEDMFMDIKRELYEAEARGRS
ncbi:uncharacterized protein JN550_001648 [Neoarthrinium moseri]|uniref:uncharacterized protein n=1 Tax=Neoarthrinium moseri TaxID=1658444 RepID=UPI001FDBCEAD|nr:uncharacterized protein JN550_001648 [Neoarthrinium moseri]KAI1876152.1 hypothetical protein JN550_001648 [Neoarthrinium moseri]